MAQPHTPDRAYIHNEPLKQAAGRHGLPDFPTFPGHPERHATRAGRLLGLCLGGHNYRSQALVGGGCVNAKNLQRSTRRLDRDGGDGVESMPRQAKDERARTSTHRDQIASTGTCPDCRTIECHRRGTSAVRVLAQVASDIRLGDVSVLRFKTPTAVQARNSP